jgi:thiamine-phosphate pyrophosphorylase
MEMSGAGDEAAVMRILDASANRAAEGVRTLEEYARFVLEDRGLTEEAKSIRHELQLALAELPHRDRLTARAVETDCGTTLTSDTERSREDLLAVVGAASGRVQEALRCIEEFSKPLGKTLSGKAKSLRYRAYSLAATLMLMRQRCERLVDARLYLLIGTGDLTEETFARRLEELFEAGVDLVQLRDKAADDFRLYRFSKIGAQTARRNGKLFIVNDRADIAVAAGAQGVHVGQEELPVEAVRRVVGSGLIIGVSTHDIDQVRRAIAAGADYIGCGPTFPSRTKSFANYPGVEFLRQVAAQTKLPAYAIGGVSSTNVVEVVATGIHGIAVADAITGAEDPRSAAAELKRLLTAGLG